VKSPAIKSIYAAVVLSGVIYAFVVLRGPNGIPGLRAKQAMIHEYEQSNQKMQRQIEEKQERIKRLQEDSGNTPELEYEIRNRLKLAKPGEKIYILDDKKQ
jgi:cell division protein FtsB